MARLAHCYARARGCAEADPYKKDVTYKITSRNWEATSGFEPLVQLLQSRALPLGDVAAAR
jgi:hypothetical protein